MMRRFEIVLRSGSLIVVALSMILTVCIAYTMGFSSGRADGIEVALRSTEVYAAKLPVAPLGEQALDIEEVSSEIYNRLSVGNSNSRVTEESASAELLVPTLTPTISAGQSAKVLGDLMVTPPTSTVTPAITSTPKPPTLVGRRISVGSAEPGWYVQVAAPGQVEEAESLSNKLAASGFPVVIEDVQVGEQKFFRVLVGPERSRETAERLKQQILRESFVTTKPFVKQVIRRNE